MAEYELKKGLSVWLLYAGLVILALSAFMFFKKKVFSPVITFVGFIAIIVWYANRKDEMCPTSIDDNSPCIEIN